jgi:hypothetical protein
MDEQQYRHIRTELRWIGYAVVAILFLLLVLLKREGAY